MEEIKAVRKVFSTTCAIMAVTGLIVILGVFLPDLANRIITFVVGFILASSGIMCLLLLREIADREILNSAEEFCSDGLKATIEVRESYIEELKEDAYGVEESE